MALPGAANVSDAGAKDAVIPSVAGMLKSAVASAITPGFACDWTTAVRGRSPGTAELTAPVVMAICCEAPGPSVTWVVDAWAASAAGPARVSVKVSLTVPVLVTVAVETAPGAGGSRAERNAHGVGDDVERGPRPTSSPSPWWSMSR